MASFAMLLAFPVSSDAQQRKAMADIDTDAMTGETQFSAPCSSGHMNLIWAIPVEFWKASFASDDSMSEQQRTEIIASLEDFVIVGVVQADIGDSGAFDFYSEEEVTAALKIAFTDTDGRTRSIAEAEDIPEATQQLLNAIKPILTAAMGQMGQNFHFVVIKDEATGSDGSKRRAWDPYAFGELTLSLKSREGAALSAKLPGPIDALFVPRKCPNGKNAHVTWKFCPWTGVEL